MSTTKDKSQGPYTVQWSDREAGYVVTGPTEDGTYAMSEGSANVYANQLNAAYSTGQADRDELVKALKRQRDAIHAVNFYRANRNNPHAQKPLNSDVQEMWKELKESNNAAAALLSRYPNP